MAMKSINLSAPGVSIGHIHLKVADLERAIVFYHDVPGFEVTDRFGRQAAFLSAGGYHHHIGLNTWESADGQPPARGVAPEGRRLAVHAHRTARSRIAPEGALNRLRRRLPSLSDAVTVERESSTNRLTAMIPHMPSFPAAFPRCLTLDSFIYK